MESFQTCYGNPHKRRLIILKQDNISTKTDKTDLNKIVMLLIVMKVMMMGSYMIVEHCLEDSVLRMYYNYCNTIFPQIHQWLVVEA